MNEEQLKNFIKMNHLENFKFFEIENGYHLYLNDIHIKIDTLDDPEIKCIYEDDHIILNSEYNYIDQPFCKQKNLISSICGINVRQIDESDIKFLQSDTIKTVFKLESFSFIKRNNSYSLILGTDLKYNINDLGNKIKEFNDYYEKLENLL